MSWVTLIGGVIKILSMHMGLTEPLEKYACLHPPITIGVYKSNVKAEAIPPYVCQPI